ncbi:hypothetical protein SAMN05444921_13336 [Streptomyces wuyuanensis]|uniref:Uncharacterized protein n=1 Tax=Streptomyces wuyuanensis TaxID=1196353 RepID=A0A1H0DCY9_9ACTN|nr:hypothetical protein SAMN05444921_13336 [Streptomyces wuyuanensis]
MRQVLRSSPRPRSARTVAEIGCGLLLVSQLSCRRSSRRVPGGEIVWAEADLAPA